MRGFERGFFLLSKLLNFLKNFDSQLKMGPISVVSPISKKISTFLAALFKQLLDLRIYFFLKIFAKSINKLTRGDYVNWGTLSKLPPNTEITRFDGTTPSTGTQDPLLSIFKSSISNLLYQIFCMKLMYR